MNVDDETILSAYLDGELDADQRLQVEAALAAYPALGDHLRELAAVRDMVAHLPRLTSERDLSDSVVAAITRSQAEGSVTRRHHRVARVRMFGEVAMAASVLVGLTLGLRTVLHNVPPRPVHPVIAHRPTAPSAPAKPPIASAMRRPISAESPAAFPKVLDPVPISAPPPIIVARAGAVGDEVEREQSRTTIRSLLDSPNAEIYVVDLVGGHAIDGIEDIIKGVPRRDSSYGRITVPQGIALDPQHPGDATVFAIPIEDGRERRDLLARLRASFPDAFEPRVANPLVVTQLADMSDATIRLGTRSNSADLVPPPQDVTRQVTAIRSAPKEKMIIKPPVPDEFPGMNVMEVREEGPTPEQMRSQPHRSLRGLKDSNVKAPPAEVAAAPALASAPVSAPSTTAKRGSILLVWVTDRRSVSGHRP